MYFFYYIYIHIYIVCVCVKVMVVSFVILVNSEVLPVADIFGICEYRWIAHTLEGFALAVWRGFIVIFILIAVAVGTSSDLP